MALQSTAAHPYDHVLVRPVNEATELIRQGKIKDAKVRLSVPDVALEDQDFCNQLIELEHGFRLWRSQRHGEAAPHFAQATKLISVIVNHETKAILQFISSTSHGIFALNTGDTTTALKNLEAANSYVKPLTVNHPDFILLSWGVQSAAYASLAQFHASRGEFGNVEKIYGRISVLYSDIKGYLERHEIKEPEPYAEIYGVLLEFHLVISYHEIMLLNFQNAKMRLNSAKNDATKFREYLEKLGDNAFKTVCESISILYDIFIILCDASEHLMEQKNEPTKELIASLENLPDMFFQAKDAALKSGPRAENLVNYIRNLQIYSDGITRMAKPRKKPAIEIGSIIFLLSFIILVTFTQYVIQPSDSTMIIYLVSIFFVSLIGGFGYGALRFLPLLNQYQKLLEAVQQKNK